jgi:hypothetical protein
MVGTPSGAHSRAPLAFAHPTISKAINDGSIARSQGWVKLFAKPIIFK